MGTGGDDFSDFVSARWPALVRTGLLLGCSVPDAEDLAQAALVRCFVRWTQVTAAVDRDAYVYRMLVNLHSDSRRRRWWGETPTDLPVETAGPDGMDEVDQFDSVRRALASLSIPVRRAIVLRYYADLSERQISEALSIAPGTVKSRLARGLAALAKDAHLATPAREEQ